MTLCATPTAIRPPIQRIFALGHENWETALGKLGSGGWVKAMLERGGGIGRANQAHVDWIVSEWSKTPTHVRRLVAEGAFVFITGRRQGELDRAVNEIGKNVVAIKCDVTKLEDLDHLYKEVAARKRKIDVLFANAGMVQSRDSCGELANISTRPSTPMRVAHTLQFKRLYRSSNDDASIITTGSGVWQKGMPIYGTYAATKAAIRFYVRTWPAEFARRGIRAHVISPGPIEIPIFYGQFATKEAAQELKKQFQANIPPGRMGRPRKLLRLPYSWLRRRAATSPVSTCLSMVACRWWLLAV